MAWHGTPGPVRDRPRSRPGLAVYVNAKLLPDPESATGGTHGVRARRHADVLWTLSGTGAVDGVHEHGAGGSDRQAAEERLKNRCADS